MRIPSGKIDQVINFVAVDATDLKTRKTGLTSFTVYRSRNGGAATVYTTPTITELSAANMPGHYTLLIDEDTTIASTSDSEEYAVYITQASMAPVSRVIELYRRDTTSGRTIVVDAAGLADANTVKLGPTGAGTAQTPRDIGASVLLSAGTGTGQLDFTSGIVKSNMTQLLGTAAATPSTAGVIEVNVKNIANAAVNTASAQIGVNVVNFGGSAGTFASGRPEVNTTHAAGTAWNSGAITANTFAAGAITAAKFAANALDAVWSTATRVLTAGTNIVLAKGTGVTGFNDLDAPGVRTAVGMASANLDTQLSALNSNDGTINTNVLEVKAKTDTLPAAPAAVGDIPTANQNADALLDRAAGVETNLTVRQAFRLFAGALLGKANGLGTGTANFRDTNDTKNRIVANVDQDGNRLAVNLDAS